MKLMKAAQISRPDGKFEIVERPIPEPGSNEVRIKVEACGICHSDEATKQGYLPQINYPRIPSHEIAGFVDKVDDKVINWRPGQRVGVGWHGGHCFVCSSCQKGDFVNCQNRKICGLDYDGGFV